MNKLMTLLTGALALSAADTAQQDALKTWADAHVPALISKANELLRPPFTISELSDMADEVVKAVQELKGLFKGDERAAIAQDVLVFVAQAALPDLVEPWVVPLLSGEGVKALIESAFQRVFGGEAVALPVTDAPELPSGAAE